MPKRKISPGRKTAYYFGMGLTGLGLILFFSTFVSQCSHFGDFSDFHGRAKSSMGMALTGIVLIAVGQFLRVFGHSGAAGSGLKLDPEEARKDLEPWSRMRGGMLKDTLDEAGIDLSRSSPGAELPFDEQLRRLEALKRDGLISEGEYETARKRIVDSIG